MPGRTVVIAGDRIEAVGDLSVVESGPDDVVVDLTGRTVMPGMATCHFHSTYHELGSTPLPYGSEEPPAYMALQCHQNLMTALRWGYTSVVGAGAGQDVEPGVNLAIKRGLVPGPRVVPCGRELSTTAHSNDVVPWYWGMPGSGAVRICDGPDEFRLGVREQVKRGAEIIKLFVTGGHGTTSPKARIEMTRGRAGCCHRRRPREGRADPRPPRQQAGDHDGAGAGHRHRRPLRRDGRRGHRRLRRHRRLSWCRASTSRRCSPPSSPTTRPSWPTCTTSCPRPRPPACGCCWATTTAR